jgi:hypothetical protein
MPLLLPAIQAAREAAVELERDEGEFIFGTELPAVQDGTSNTMFVGESLLPPRAPPRQDSLDGASDLGFVCGITNDTDGMQAAPPPRSLPAPILTGGKERQDDIIDVIVSLPPPPDEPVSGWLFDA